MFAHRHQKLRFINISKDNSLNRLFLRCSPRYGAGSLLPSCVTKQRDVSGHGLLRVVKSHKARAEEVEFPMGNSSSQGSVYDSV
jgi:hypothetical protein